MIQEPIRRAVDHLAGVVEEAAFQAKTTDLKRDLADVDESIEKAAKFDPDAPTRAPAIFDLSQNLAGLWQRSNSAHKREILECVSLNRTVSDVSLYVAKRRPFDFIAERLSCIMVGDTGLEPVTSWV